LTCRRNNLENKSVGKFISELRKEKGLTQKELGDRLFVSDKTISRWERDDCSPDISLLPTIAELFDVTTDELLRGERIDEKMLTNSDGVVVEPSIEQQSVGVEPQKEKKAGKSLFKSFRPFAIRLVTICCSITVLLAIVLIVLSTVKFTAKDKYDSFEALKIAVESDYDQWLEENYGSDPSAIEQANKDKMSINTMYIPNSADNSQYVEYYYHKDHYLAVNGSTSKDNKIIYVATRVPTKEVNGAKIAMWTLLATNIVVCVVVYIILNKKENSKTGQPADDVCVE
jgi:transcriptional regulator with XRE-family HTH domain